MTPYLALKYLHVLGAAALLGTGAGIAFFMLLAHRTGEARTVAAVARIVVIADFLFTATAVVAQPITGVLLAWAAGHSLSEGWIVLSTLLYLVTGAFWLPVVWRCACATSPPPPRTRAAPCQRPTTAYSASGSPSASRPSPPCWRSSG
jgi:uncharacterized membrane protein